MSQVGGAEGVGVVTPGHLLYHLPLVTHCALLPSWTFVGTLRFSAVLHFYRTENLWKKVKED